jgi:hypothetical protein
MPVEEERVMQGSPFNVEGVFFSKFEKMALPKLGKLRTMWKTIHGFTRKQSPTEV